MDGYIQINYLIYPTQTIFFYFFHTSNKFAILPFILSEEWQISYLVELTDCVRFLDVLIDNPNLEEINCITILAIVMKYTETHSKCL